jgi:hypothetical protein
LDLSIPDGYTVLDPSRFGMPREGDGVVQCRTQDDKGSIVECEVGTAGETASCTVTNADGEVLENVECVFADGVCDEEGILTCEPPSPPTKD